MRKNNWLNEKCVRIDSDKHGRGVQAISLITKGEILAVFGGPISTRTERNALSEDVKYLLLGIEEEFFIGPKSAEEMDDADYFNHSCEPNAGIQGQVSLVAMRDIMSGEEITFDYAMTAARSGDKFVLFSCNCGSKICRKEITSHDWMNLELQEKYRGYFSSYIQRLMDSDKS